MDAVLIAVITSLGSIAVAAIGAFVAVSRHGKRVDLAANGAGLVGILSDTHRKWEDCEKRCKGYELRLAKYEGAGEEASSEHA